MAKRYGHIGSTVQRAAVDVLVQPPSNIEAGLLLTVTDAETDVDL
jgi:hypothetical protein